METLLSSEKLQSGWCLLCFFWGNNQVMEECQFSKEYWNSIQIHWNTFLDTIDVLSLAKTRARPTQVFFKELITLGCWYMCIFFGKYPPISKDGRGCYLIWGTSPKMVDAWKVGLMEIYWFYATLCQPCSFARQFIL